MKVYKINGARIKLHELSPHALKIVKEGRGRERPAFNSPQDAVYSYMSWREQNGLPTNKTPELMALIRPLKTIQDVMTYGLIQENVQ